LRKLDIIFGDCESLENLEALFSFFAIIKGLISLGDRKVIEVLLSNQFFLLTFGALECKTL
jgi:hypothetical protein